METASLVLSRSSGWTNSRNRFAISSSRRVTKDRFRRPGSGAGNSRPCWRCPIDPGDVEELIQFLRFVLQRLLCDTSPAPLDNEENDQSGFQQEKDHGADDVSLYLSHSETGLFRTIAFAGKADSCRPHRLSCSQSNMGTRGAGRMVRGFEGSWPRRISIADGTARAPSSFAIADRCPRTIPLSSSRVSYRPKTGASADRADHPGQHPEA